MVEPQWKPMRASPEKFLKAENYLTKSFSGILDTMYPSQTQGEKAVGYIKLDFEGGSSMSLFGLENRNEDGTYPFGLGAFIKSAEALGLEVQEAELDGVIQDIRLLENDTVLEKPKLWIKGIEEKKIGETTQTFYKWGILEKYEATAPASSPAKKLGKYPPKQKPAKEQPPAQADITGIVLDALGEPASISEVFTALGKKYKVSELRVALESLKDQGVVIESGGKYQIT